MFSVVLSSVPDLLHQRCCAPIGQVLLLPLLAPGGTQLEQSVPSNPPLWVSRSHPNRALESCYSVFFQGVLKVQVHVLASNRGKSLFQGPQSSRNNMRLACEPDPPASPCFICSGICVRCLFSAQREFHRRLSDTGLGLGLYDDRTYGSAVEAFA